MQMAKQIKIVGGMAKTSLRISEDLYWKFQAAIVERRLPSDQAGYAEAIEQWLGETGTKPIPNDAHPDLPPNLQPFLDKLVKILQSGDQSSILAITTHIDQSLERLRPMKGGRKVHPPPPSGH